MEPLNANQAQAPQSVVALVDQPVAHLPRTAEAAVFSAGFIQAPPSRISARWTSAQEFPCANDTYVTSDVNPDEMFVANELEFNAMTKYFYTDRATPKKRLSEHEMLEIDQLYRTIGHDEKALEKADAALAGAFLLALLLVASPILFIRRSGQISV